MNTPKTLLVTGAAGFIGARFVESCLQKKIKVIAVDHPEHFKRRDEHRAVAYPQIVDRSILEDWLDRNRTGIHGVVHLGACTDTTNLDVAHHRRMNLEYSKMLWNWCTRHEIPLVYASSAATYGDGALGYDDDETKIPELKPLNPYGASKQQFDVWALEQERSGKHPPQWSAFKFFNVYGFGERHKKGMASVVLHSFDQIKAGGKVRLFKSHKEGIADGHQKRDFVCVEDVVRVLHFAVSKPIERGIYNLGTGTARTFLDLTRAVFQAMGRPENIEFIDTPEVLRERYQYFTQANMAKLQSQGYAEPFTSLEDGVRNYVRRLITGR